MNLMKLRKLMQFKSDTLHIAFWLILFAAIVNCLILISKGFGIPACPKDGLDMLIIALASPWFAMFLMDVLFEIIPESTISFLLFCFIPFFCNLSILVLLNAYYEKVKKITKIGFKGLLFLWCMVILQIFVTISVSKFLKGFNDEFLWSIMFFLTWPWQQIYSVLDEFHNEYSHTPFVVINAIILFIFTIRYFVKKRRIAKAEG